MSTTATINNANPTVQQQIRTKHDGAGAEMEVISLTQQSHKKDASQVAVTTQNTTTTTTTTSQSKTVKVSNINVADERFHLSMIGLLGCVLSQLVLFEESQYPQGRGSISMFHTAYVPSISIGSYLKRIALYTKVSSEVLIQSVLHVHQLMQRSQNPLIVNKLNIHRLLLTSIMATAKFFDDAHYNNSYFSFVGGVPLKELNALEVEFLSLLNFDFYVNTQTYQYFYSMVIERNIHQNGCTCSSLLHGLPKTLPVSEYTPDPEVLDFPEPLSSSYYSTPEPSVSVAMEDDALMEPITTNTTTAMSRGGSLSSASDDFFSATSSRSSDSTTAASSIESDSTLTPKASSEPPQVVVVVVPPQPSALMDDMGEELGSIKIEEDPMSVGTEDENDEIDVTPEQTPKVATRTPKRLSAAHLQVVQHQHHHHSHSHPGHTVRSASPPSFLSSSSMTSSSSTLSSSTVEGSPVSSSYASSVSSYNQPSRQRMTHQQHQLHTSQSYSNGFSGSPSTSLHHSFHNTQGWGSSVVAEGEEDGDGLVVDEYLATATPRQSSATPLAKSNKDFDMMDLSSHQHDVAEKERFYQHQQHQRDHQMGEEDPTVVM